MTTRTYFGGMHGRKTVLEPTRENDSFPKATKVEGLYFLTVAEAQLVKHLKETKEFDLDVGCSGRSSGGIIGSSGEGAAVVWSFRTSHLLSCRMAPMQDM
jgi:hypothetical protein